MSKRHAPEPGFSFRWGVNVLDEGFTTIPNRFLRAYSKLGVTRTEMLFILHLASYHYESDRGVARPSLITVTAEMGYKDVRNVQTLRSSLEKKHLLAVEPRMGQPSIYSLAPFARAAMREQTRHEQEQEDERAINHALRSEHNILRDDQLIRGRGDQLITLRRRSKEELKQEKRVIQKKEDVPRDLPNAGQDAWEQVWALIVGDVRLATGEPVFRWFAPTHLERVEKLKDGSDLFVVSHPTEYGCEALGDHRLIKVLQRATAQTVSHPVTYQFIADGRHG